MQPVGAPTFVIAERQDTKGQDRLDGRLVPELIGTINSQPILASFGRQPIRFNWQEAVRLSGYTPPPPKPRGRYNAAAFAARKTGWRTIGEVCAAADVRPNTLCDQERDGKVPKMKRVHGIRSISADQFDDHAARCRAIKRRSRYVGAHSQRQQQATQNHL